MQRYNIFYLVHKGLRQMLYQVATRLQQVDFINAEEVDLISDMITETLDLFDKHANTEDKIVLPQIERMEPSIVNLFEQEHVEDHALSNRMRALLNMYHHTVSSEEKVELGSAIRLAFIEFMIFNLKHMAKEENELNNLLWKYYSDTQLQELTQRIIAEAGPETSAKNMRWMLRAISNNEIVNWLKDTKNNASEQVFGYLLAIALEELPADRCSKVIEGITEGAMVA